MNEDLNGLGVSAIIAIALIPVVSLIKRPEWGSRVNYLIGIIAAAIAAVGGAVVDGGKTTWQEWVVSIFTALGASQTIYMTYFQNTNINDKLAQVGAV